MRRQRPKATAAAAAASSASAAAATAYCRRRYRRQQPRSRGVRNWGAADAAASSQHAAAATAAGRGTGSTVRIKLSRARCRRRGLLLATRRRVIVAVGASGLAAVSLAATGCRLAPEAARSRRHRRPRVRRPGAQAAHTIALTAAASARPTRRRRRHTAAPGDAHYPVVAVRQRRDLNRQLHVRPAAAMPLQLLALLHPYLPLLLLRSHSRSRRRARRPGTAPSPVRFIR